jgi:dienelactone hydrolase
MKTAVLPLLALLTACGESEADPLPPPGDAIVRFDLADAPMRLGAVPWPSELYRDAKGRIALGEIDNPYSSAPMLTATRELLATRDGFCTTCNIVLEIEGGLIPPDVRDAPQLDDALVLVDVDPESPELGRTFPLRMQWDESAGRLSLRPARGSTLAARRRYAFVVTDAAHGSDDLPIGPAPTFAAVRDGTDDRWAHATATLEPALAELEALGLPRARVRGLAAFTTEDPTADLRAIRSVIRAGPPAAAIVDRVFTGDAIDDLLGVPATDRPGIDVRPAEGIDGTSSIRHATTAIVIAGRFPAPRFVEGSGTDVGATTRDAAGSPIATRVEDVPFVLIVPRDVDLRRLPVVVAHHGFNASRVTGFALADTAGHAGFAVLAIDAYQHGDRAASATDGEHAMRNVDGPDGFAETVALDVSARVFGLLPPDPALTLYPAYPLGAFEQFAADAMAAVRFVADGDLSSLRAADPILAQLAFDRERIAYLGNSMGAVVGTSVATVEPDVRAVVLDVMPGSIMETLAESGEFRPLSEDLLMPRIGVDEEFDEIERAMLFDPTVDLFRWVLEPVDPLALARSLVHERVAGSAPHILVQLAGHDEVAAPPASESVLAAAGIPAQGELRFAPVEPIALPLEDAPAIAAIRFDGAMHGMYEVAQQTSRYAAPLDVPLLLVDPPVARTNPIEAVHVQIETFLASFGSGGPVVIVP